MKLYNSTTILIFCLVAAFSACGGGGGGDDDTGDSVEVCEGGVCTSISEDTRGNFIVGTYQEEDVTNLPDISVDEDTLTTSCSGDETTEKGYKYFRCSLTDSGDVGVDCFRGIAYIFDGANPYEQYTSTGCPSINFYCDSYGFYAAEVCNSSLEENLVTDDDVNEETPADDMTTLFQLVE